jgi:endo-1,4-beta-D-glucanase Y
MPTNLPATGTYGKSQDAATAYDAWKSTYVADCDNGTKRVKFDTQSQTVSEGIAYGMLLSAYAGDKDLFDGLWGYYNNWKNSNGVMNWKIDGCDKVIGANGAVDAEFDTAMALIIASVQWPSGTYKTDANSLIGIIKDKEMNANGHAKPGDMWDSYKNPGYYSPAYYREFAKVNIANAEFWNGAAITAANSLLLANRHPQSGLISDWSDVNGNPVRGNGNIAGEYAYEGIRNPWRMTTDYLWNGATVATTAADICGKVAAWIKGDETNLKIPLTDRSQKLSTGTDKNGASYMTALASMASTEQNSLNSLYTFISNSNNFQWDTYYGVTLRCITLFMMTGNFWSPDGNSTGINEVSCGATMRIYPNPAKNGVFNVELPNSDSAVLTIVNMDGQAIYSTVVKNGFTTINTGLGAGVYIASMQSKNGLKTQKLVIKGNEQ